MIKDPARVSALLDIVHKVAGVGPGYTHISSEAMAELRQVEEEIRKGKLKEQGRPVTPAQFGDEGSPPEAHNPEADPALEPHPTATSPIERDVGEGPRTYRPGLSEAESAHIEGDVNFERKI